MVKFRQLLMVFMAIAITCMLRVEAPAQSTTPAPSAVEPSAATTPEAKPAAEAILASCFVPDGKNTSFTSAQWKRLMADSSLLLRLFALSSRPQHEAQAFALGRVRGARLKLALTLYQVHEGKPAPSLAHLVPRHLDELPLDPFSGLPYHYRVSTGERIDWRQGISDDRPPWTDIPAGQGILWSVGPEAFGKIGMRDTPSAPTAADQVFIVPSWLK